MVFNLSIFISLKKVNVRTKKQQVCCLRKDCIKIEVEGKINPQKD